jgi:hypothetical protein
MSSVSCVEATQVCCKDCLPFKYSEESSPACDSYQLNLATLPTDKNYVCMLLLPLKITSVMLRVMAHFEEKLFPPIVPRNEQFQSCAYCLACKSQAEVQMEHSIPVIIFSFPRDRPYDKVLEVLGQVYGAPLNHSAVSFGMTFPKLTRSIKILIPESENILVFADTSKEPHEEKEAKS